MNKIVPSLIAVTMALAGLGVCVGDAHAEPGRRGAWRGHGGYHDGSGWVGPGRHRGSRYGRADAYAAELPLPPPVERRARMLTRVLELDGFQTVAVRRILAHEVASAQAILASPIVEARGRAMFVLRRRTNARIGSILTPSQRATWARIEAARRSERDGDGYTDVRPHDGDVEAWGRRDRGRPYGDGR